MLTFFTTAKPFVDHDGIIQRNALRSWKLLHPDVEVILFGDEEGAAEVCGEFGLRHEPDVEREGKVPYANLMFARAQRMARHEYVCYANCDIVLFKDFLEAFEISRGWRGDFLGVGRRWDVDVTEPINFQSAGWDRGLRTLTAGQGTLRDDYWVDFFVFHRGMYENMPPLVVGYCYWDNWMIWKALSSAVPVIDLTAVVMAVHQNHEYAPMSGRVKGVATDARSVRNLKVAGGQGHVRSVKAATHVVGVDRKVRRNLRRYTPSVPIWLGPTYRFLTYGVWLPAWHFALSVTRPLRRMLNLRSRNERGLRR